MPNPVTRKLIELPSGARVKIRPLSIFDFHNIDPKVPASGSRVILTQCTGQIRFKDGSRKKIVDRHFDDTDDLTEITPEELDQADIEKIVTAVSSMSGIIREEAGSKSKPFPEEAGNQCPSAGATLLPESAGGSEPVAG